MPRKPLANTAPPEFEQRMETRRRAETEEEWDSVRRGWCLGGDNFRKQLLEKMETALGESHAGDLKQESAIAKPERIIAEELQRLGWTQADLRLRLKGDPQRWRCEKGACHPPEKGNHHVHAVDHSASAHGHPQKRPHPQLEQKGEAM